MRQPTIVFLMGFLLCAFPEISFGQRQFETTFKREEHKDGYHINGITVSIPDDIARRCDGKKIRVKYTAASNPEEKWHKLGTAPVMQCDCEMTYKITAKGDTLEKQVRRSSYAGVNAIYLWDEPKKDWELVYEP